MTIHFNLGNDILREDVRQHIAGLARSLPSAEFSLVLTGTALASLLGDPRAVPVVGNVPTVAPTAPTPRAAAVEAPAPAPAEAASAETTGTRFRRTKAETDAGLTVEEAQFFRQSGGGDPVAYKASLTKSAAPQAPAQEAAPAAPPPPPPPPPVSDAPPVITEADVRAAAVKGVQSGKKDAVIAIAKEYGVTDWKTLDPSKYGEVLSKLTAVMVVN